MSQILRKLPLTCPTCGAEVLRAERADSTHVNGNRHEEARYACGCQLEYIPNFDMNAPDKPAAKLAIQTPVRCGKDSDLIVVAGAVELRIAATVDKRIDQMGLFKSLNYRVDAFDLPDQHRKLTHELSNPAFVRVVRAEVQQRKPR